MNRSLPMGGRLIAALLTVSLLPMVAANAQQQGYQAPNFAAAAGPQFHQAQQIPAFPASPLAGGPAAQQGGEFVDVQGKDIIVQTQYAQGCPPGMGGYGGYSDPMAIDFGGYGQDQVGPHYFDVSADVVFLQATELFDGVGPLTVGGVPGVGNPTFLDPDSNSDDYEPGWQIAARYDIGALAVLEVAYMGIYDIGFSDSITSVDATAGLPGGSQPFSLFTPDFDQFNPIDAFDFSNRQSIDYQSDLQSTEITYRRYWVGNNPRVSGTWLAGARYLRLTEDFTHTSEGLVNAAPVVGSRLYSSENDMVGFQFGGDGWIGLRQGLRIGGEAKAGVYNNHFKFRNAATLPSNPDFDVLTTGDQVAFAGEGGATIVADILPSLSLRGGYRVLYMSSIATVGASINPNPTVQLVGDQGHALYHGFHGGLEYVW